MMPPKVSMAFSRCFAVIGPCLSRFTSYPKIQIEVMRGEIADAAALMAWRPAKTEHSMKFGNKAKMLACLMSHLSPAGG